MTHAYEQLIADTIRRLYHKDIAVVLDRPEPNFGDLTTNVAMRLATELAKNPRDIAEVVAVELRLEADFSEVSVAGPGFINITQSDEALAQTIRVIIDQQHRFGVNSLHAGKVVVAEYSDPNPFKTLHAGHLYTSLVGDAVARLYEIAGAHVVRVNFGGDVGRHVATAMWGIITRLGGELPEELAGIPQNDRLDWISECYVAGTIAYETDTVAKNNIDEYNKRVYQLHELKDKETPFAQIYWQCRSWSYEGFDALYRVLQMKPFDHYYPESETTPFGLSAIQEGLEKGIFEYSDNAVVYRGEDEGLHTRVFMTGQGLPTYEAKDLGLAVKKWQDYRFDLNVMITGNDIVEYMKVVQAALRRFIPEISDRTVHLTHGMIKLAGGVKMSSRKGNVLRATDVLDAATKANLEATGGDNHSAVLAAVKYSFLKQRIGGDIVYDPNESVSVVGNSGPYLQYAHARAASIIRQSNSVPRQEDYQLASTERALVRQLSIYPEIVELAVSDRMPHHICHYLFELAQEFNRFYEQERVIGDDREGERILLIKAYCQVLRNGLDILGIEAPDHM